MVLFFSLFHFFVFYIFLSKAGNEVGILMQFYTFGTLFYNMKFLAIARIKKIVGGGVYSPLGVWILA